MKSRRELEREARRRHMLDAARAVFAERGFRRATLDEIAHRSEFGKGTIYNYFPDGKDQMLFAVLDDIYDGVHAISERVFAANSDGSFRENLEQYVESTIQYFLDDQELFFIVLKEANRMAFSDDRSKSEYLKRQFDRMSAVLESPIESAIENGELRPFPVKAVANMILGNVHGYLRYHCLSGIGSNSTNQNCEIESAREAAVFLSEMLMNGLGRNAERTGRPEGELAQESLSN